MSSERGAEVGVTVGAGSGTSDQDPPPAPQDPSEEGGVGGGSALIRIHVPELNVNKCLQFARDELVWNVKQQCLAALPKELRESFNYGLFAPPTNGKAGKFLDEERRLTDYPFSGPVGYLELKYKRRVYKMLHLDEKQLKALHTRANLRRLLDYVSNRQVEKVAKMCSKGLDPNFHCAETGETPLTLAAATPRSSKVLLALVNGGAILDYRTRDGSTAIHRAVERNNFEALKTLLDLGASPNYKDARSLTPLYLAMTPSTDPMLCEALLHDHATIGAQDTQGWQEVHQACRHGLVQHLEHLLFYGADMNARNASGNTPLHVCAVNSQESCLRLLLFRGSDREALNFANQTPYQVAVIAGNLELAETIQKHRPEEVVPFREPPRYNPKRRPSSMMFLARSGSEPRLDVMHTSMSATHLHHLTSSGHGGGHHSLPPCSASSYALLGSATVSTPSPPMPQGKPPLPPPPSSPSPSERSLPPGFSSACSSLSEASSSSGAHHEAGDSSEDAASASIVTDKSLLDQCDIISDSSGVGTSNSGGSAGSGGGYDTGGAGLLLAGVTAVCVENYSSNTSGHLCLAQGDIVEVTGATDCGLLEGTSRGRSGLFPAHCVQEVRMRQGASSTLRVQGRREANLKHFATAPRIKKPRLPAEPRTVVLHRSRKGFGFVLRGAKATSPLMELTPSERCPALQYLDDVDAGGVADVAGLRKGDYLLEINGEDVSQASHEHVVELIRRSGDLVAMRVVSLGEAGINPGTKTAASTLPSRQCQTLPRKGALQNRNPAPLPPRRDPKTTLSVGRARARSLVAELDGGSNNNVGHTRPLAPLGGELEEADSEEHTTKSSSTESVQARGTPPRTASIRARPTSSRITAAELEELFARQGPAPPSPAGSGASRTPRVYASVAEMKRSRGKRQMRGGVMESIHKTFSSTPDLAHLSPSHNGARTWSGRGARSQEDISWWSHPTQTSAGHVGTTSLGAGPREYAHAWHSMERLHTEHEAVTRSLSQRTRSLPRTRPAGPPPPPTHPPPPPPVGQLVRVEVTPRTKGSGSEYANVRELPAGQAADVRNGRGTPTSPEPIMSSFRPGPAKLYACPEEVKPLAYRAGVKASTLGRREGKGRSQSLPPSGARPQVRRHSKGDGGSTSPAGNAGAGYSSFKPPEANSVASTAPSNNNNNVNNNNNNSNNNNPPSPVSGLVGSPMSLEVENNKSVVDSEQGSNNSNPYAQPFQYTAAPAVSSTTTATPTTPAPNTTTPAGAPKQTGGSAGAAAAAVTTTAAAPPIPEPDYSMSEDESEGEESQPQTRIQRRSSAQRQSSKEGPLSPSGANSPSVNGTPNGAPMSPVFKELLAQKVAERQTRVNGAGTPGEEQPPASPRQPGTGGESSSSSGEQPSTNGNGGGLSHSFSVEEIQKVKTQLKSSKSYPNDFSQEDGDNSSSGVSSDQDTQPEPPKTESPCPSPPKPTGAVSQAAAAINKAQQQHQQQLQATPAQQHASRSQRAQAANHAQPGRLPLQQQQQQQQQHKGGHANKPEERTWQPDGKEASPSDQQPVVEPGKVRRKSEELGQRRTGTLTRHAVSLVQLPPPQEAETEVEPSSHPVNTRQQRPVKSVTFVTPDQTPAERAAERVAQERERERERMLIERERERERIQQERERERLMHLQHQERERERERERAYSTLERQHKERGHDPRDGPIQATKLIMPNHRQPTPSAHLRQSLTSQRSRSTDLDTGRPVEMERSIEESLQLIQRHVEQLSLVVPPPPEFDGAARMAAAAAAAAHAHHMHHHHHHPLGGNVGPMGSHPMHSSYPGHPMLPPHLRPTLPQIQDGHLPHPGAFPVGHPLHPSYKATQQQHQQQQAEAQAHHSHLYHLQPAAPPPAPSEESAPLVAPPPEFSDTGEPHKMTIRVGASSPSPSTLTGTLQRQRQLEELARQRHLEEVNRQRAEALKHQQQQSHKNVRIVGSVPKKAPSK